MKKWALFAVSVPLLTAQTGRERPLTVTAVRHWAMADVTRVAVEVSGPFEFRIDRAHNPERVFFDIPDARPLIDSRRVFSQEMDGRFAQRIRVAENVPGTTRVVIDLLDRVDVTTSILANPYRLMIELRAVAAGSPSTRENSPPPAPVQPAPKPAAQSKIAVEPPVARPEPAVQTAQATPPLATASKPTAPPLAPASKASAPSKTTVEQPVIPDVVPVAQTSGTPAEPVSAKPAPKQPSTPATRKPPATAQTAKQVEIAAAAKRTSDGEASLTRVLGLKIGRVVIDPGHGGHDQGTSGPKGLLEKDLVLDVAMRLGKLIEERMGSQVIYTRTDDTFIPLHERTAMANDNRADLFLSVHANNSANPKIAGVETFYLNVTGSRDAMDVAARENASSDKSVFELADMIQKIAKADKAEESREFAGRVQASLSSFSSKYVPNSHDRGVKTAPFVVLIGARMPSVLAEIGFLSNPREEALFKKPEHRQRLAEALYKGLFRYVESLSHFQVAESAVKQAAAGSK